MKDIILHGDVYASLERLEDNSVAVAITSPPYWKQRDYGFEGQIGQEDTPEEYISRLVKVFSLLRRKMRDDGVFFLNVGDKYLNQYGKSHLLQIPYRLAYHMVKDGWRLEDIIIWYKTNHMPSSVKDRFTNTYEPVMVFTKSEVNIYRKGMGNVVKIPLQQTPWKHTAVFPERLVEEMLRRTSLHDGDIVLDPFAGTGTVGVIVKRFRSGLFPKRVYAVLIERNDEFVGIIKERTKIQEVEEVVYVPYSWELVKDEDLPRDVEPKELLTDRHGEAFIAEDHAEFISYLKGITTAKFKSFHREDALYFLGVRQWTLEDLYYVHAIFNHGYVLRNMIVVSNGEKWYPVFMFARDSTRVQYKFYLDRLRVPPKTKERRDWFRENFVGMKVRDISGKETKEGRIVKVLERYSNGFPKVVLVKWDGDVSIELVLNPDEDELVMEGISFRCPKCGYLLEEPYDPIGENKCPNCGTELWTDVSTLPKIEEPKQVLEALEELKNTEYSFGETITIEEFEDRKKRTKSKFVELDRVNWGASPGARKTVLGEYFTKMRLYRLDQPTVAQYLTVLRKSKGLSVQDIIDRLPPSYKHTVGHWFRKDFGGSIPVRDDVKLLRSILGDHEIFDVLERTALKFQTVKASVKGENPGDFIEGLSPAEVVDYLRKLYIPPRQYVKIVMPR